VRRSTVYDPRRQAATTAPPAKRGPQNAYSDGALAGHIRATLQDAPFTGEGRRKVWARLRWQHGIRANRRRVLRLMREQLLLAPQRAGRSYGPQVHNGTIRDVGNRRGAIGSSLVFCRSLSSDNERVRVALAP
jgi:hypothetical protein